MKAKLFQSIALIFLLSLLFVVDASVARAADCTSFGYALIGSDKPTISKGGSVNLRVSYKWGVSPAPASCYDQPVYAYFMSGPVGLGTRVDLGVIQRDGDAIIEKKVDYADLTQASPSTSRVDVEFFVLPGGVKQTVATTYITLNIENDTTTYACVAADSKYACSPDGTLKGCQDNISCQSSKNPKAGCTLLADKDKCGQFASTPGGNTGSPGGNTGSPTGGKNVSFSFSIPNPLKADDFMGLIGAIATWIFNLAIPVAVIIIVWAGLRFMWARGDAGEVGEAKKMLKYAVIGLVIIFIGRGFISLIQSIINLGAK